MPLSNVTVSHLSPMVVYWPETGWDEDTVEDSKDDQLLPGYSTKSTHRTKGGVENASVTFQWHGQGGIWVYGGYRKRLGSFKIILNGTKTFTVGGFKDGDPEQARKPLFSQADIPPGRHQMQIVNPGGNDDDHGVLDLDYIIFQTSTLTTITTIPDNSSDITWLPDSSEDKSAVWRQTSNSHFTNNTNGRVEYSFNVSTGIEVWGSLSAQSAPFVVSVDGWQGKTFLPNINKEFPIDEPQLLFCQYGLNLKEHTLQILNDATDSDRSMIDIHSFKVADADVVTPSPPSSSLSKSHSKTVGIAVGVSIGGIVILSLFLIFLWRWFRISRDRKIQEYNLVRPRPLRPPRPPSGSPMASVVFASVHSTAERLSQQFRPAKRFSRDESENLMDESRGQELTVPTNLTMDSNAVELPTSPQATIVPEEYEGGSILVPLDSYRSSYNLSRTPTLTHNNLRTKKKPTRSTTLETLCGDNPDDVPLLDPTLPPRLPSMAFSPLPSPTMFPRVSRVPSDRVSMTSSRISPSGPREPRTRSRTTRKSSQQTTNPPTSFLNMARSSQSTAGHTTLTNSSP